MKKLIRMLVGVIVVVLVILVISRNFIVKNSIEKCVAMSLNLPLEIGNLDIGLLSTKLEINNLIISNPDSFEETMMLNMPQILIDYKLLPVLAGKVHLENIAVNLEEFVIVRNSKNEMNIDVFRDMMKSSPGKETEPAKKSDKPKKSGKTEFQIDNLSLDLGRVVFKDYSAGGEPSVKTLNLNIHEKYENITNLYALISLITFKAMGSMGLAEFQNIDVDAYKKSMKSMLGKAKESLKELKEQNDAGEPSAVPSEDMSTQQEELNKALEDAEKAISEQNSPFGDSFKKALQDMKESSNGEDN